MFKPLHLFVLLNLTYQNVVLSFIVKPPSSSNRIIGKTQNENHSQQQLLFRTKNNKKLIEMYGINEWRESESSNSVCVMENNNGKNDLAMAMKLNDGTILPREICLLPFPYNDVLLQGETKEIRLYEDRFIELFEKSMKDHGGIIGMALLVNDSSILKPIPICEIESYNRMAEFGIFCTIRAVSRATLIRFMSYEPYITAVCVEKIDAKQQMGKKQYDLLNYLASNIENTILTISSLEFQLKEKMEKMKRLSINDIGIVNNDNHDEEDEEEDSLSRFRQAFLQARESDSQGYTTISSFSTLEDVTESTPQRSIQDLHAISWAAFSFKPLLDIDPALRTQVLDSSRLLDRLYMGIYVVREKKKELMNRLTDLNGRAKRKQTEYEDENDDDAW